MQAFKACRAADLKVCTTLALQASGDTLVASQRLLACSGRRNGLEQAGDDLIGVDAVGLRLEIQQDAVPEHRQRDGADVLGRRDAPAVRAARAAFAPSTSAWPARGPAPHFTHCRTGARHAVGGVAGRTARAHDPQRVVDDVRRRRHVAHQVPHRLDVGRASPPA